ncbi:MAG TPA: biopolymer transporter ExbD [Candidatus Acidoferrales bacterium]|nr:biopolymer transporter ExbD [Candidatus Acidoferrales bacterium]
MQVGATRGGVVADPNIVPLIDVLLVLIIIFMVITPTMSNGLPVVIPQPAPPKATEPLNPDTVVVRVSQDGKLMINQDAVAWNALGARLSEIFSQRAEKVAFVTGAERASFAQVARAIDIMRTAGIDRVGLITTTKISR